MDQDHPKSTDPPRLSLSYSSESLSATPRPPSAQGPSSTRPISGPPDSLSRQSIPPALHPNPGQTPWSNTSQSQREDQDHERQPTRDRSSPPLPPIPPMPIPVPGSSATVVPTRLDTSRSNTASQLGMPVPHPGMQRMSTMDFNGQRRDRSTGRERGASTARRSEIDWVVPTVEKEPTLPREKSVGERLEPTLMTAIAEKEKYAFKAKLTSWSLNAAIGMQVILGSLTTGLSVVTTGKQTQIMTAVLGGLATIVASYLARARGSNEPELSITRVKDLEQFIRECEAFRMDHGHILGDGHDSQLEKFRERFEELLGNANGERKLSPPV